LKLFFPKIDTDRGHFKYKVISLFPDLPGCNDENFHEEIVNKILFCQLKHLEERGAKLPLDANQLPTIC
jgi:hypothetical protein